MAEVQPTPAQVRVEALVAEVEVTQEVAEAQEIRAVRVLRLLLTVSASPPARRIRLPLVPLEGK